MGQLCSGPQRDVDPNDVDTAVANSKRPSPLSSNESYDFVIVGGGVAGGYALNEFLELKKKYPALIGKKSLLLITAESHYPYERPALTKGFLLKANKVDLPMFNACAFIGSRRTDEWYKTEGKDNDITVKLSTTVESIDYDRRTFICVDNRANSKKTLSYDKLLLATGTRATKFSDFKVEGSINCDNIYYMRDYDDAKRVRDEIVVKYNRKQDENENENKKNDEKPTVVMIGGGYIGMEAGAALLDKNSNNLDINVVFTFPEKYFMEISMFKTIKNKETEISKYYTNLFKNCRNEDDNGVTLINGGGSNHFVSKFNINSGNNNKNHATSVVLKDGTMIKGDYFIVGIIQR